MNIPGYRVLETLEKDSYVESFFAWSSLHNRCRVQIFDLKAHDASLRFKFDRLVDLYRNANLVDLERVIEQGIVGDRCYVVFDSKHDEETLRQKTAAGITLIELTEAMEAIAKLLNSVYEAGLVYGLLTPARVLVRPDRSIYLKDVFYANLLEECNIDRSQASLLYGSPEQCMNSTVSLDGDLYSLGMMTYESLIGELPWRQADSFSVRRATQPVPTLPKRFNTWEPVLERLLGYEQVARYQDLEEFNTDIDELRDKVDDAVLTSALVADDEIHDVVHGLEEEQEELQVTIRRQETRNYFVRALMIVLPLLAIIALLYLPQTDRTQVWLSEIGIGEHPNLQSARQTAAALRADPNQSFQAIIGAFDSVLQYAPNDSEAESAKVLVKQGWENSIQLSLDRNELDRAQNRVNEILNVYPEDEAGTELFNRIQQRRQANDLLSDAEAHFDERGYEATTATTVINLYKEAARLYPENDISADRLNGYASYFATLSINAAGGGEVSQAMDYLTKARIANAEHPLLAEAREALSAAETLQAEIDSMLTLAGQLRSSGNLIMPTNNNAAALYQQVLSIDIENVIAFQGLEAINTEVIDEFKDLIQDKEFAFANEMLDAAIEVGLSSTTIDALKLELNTGLSQTAIAAGLVQDASSLYALGYITEPPENNAVSILRQALRFDPNNADALSLLQQCSARLARVAQDAHRAGFRDQAELYLELALFVSPNKTELQVLQESWRQAESDATE